MITKNFKALLSSILLKPATTDGGAYGFIPVKITNGNTVYIWGGVNSSTYPCAMATNVVTSETSAGIVFGSGTSAPIENDYKIETVITGITGTVSYIRGFEDGDPYVKFQIVVTNNNASDIIVSEVALNQSIRTVATQGGTGSAATSVVCIDRTLLSQAITIPAGGQKIIDYKLKSIMP